MTFRAIFALCLVLFGGILNAHAEDFTIVDLPSNYLFAPVGFDDNDEVVVVTDGYMPDTCYRFLDTQVTRDPNSGIFQIRNRAKRFDGMCFDVTVPFTSTISLGTLPAGKHSVTTNFGNLKTEVGIQKSSSTGPDDFLYAAIDLARIDRDPTDQIVLEGRLMSTCMLWDRVEVLHHGNTIEVLPILKMETENNSRIICKPEERPFVKIAQLPKLDRGRYLLHVRSLNGQSVNTVFTQY